MTSTRDAAALRDRVPLATARGWSEDDDPSRLLLGVHGRVSRRTFWLVGVVGMSVVQFYVWALLDIAGARPTVSEGVSGALVTWPAIAITAKRWHDRDRSGWWVLINAIPVAGSLWTIVQCGLLRGTTGPNRFGPDPLQIDEDDLLRGPRRAPAQAQ